MFNWISSRVTLSKSYFLTAESSVSFGRGSVLQGQKWDFQPTWVKLLHNAETPAMTSFSTGRSDPATLTPRAMVALPHMTLLWKVLLLMQLRVNWLLQRRNHNCGSFTGRTGECLVVVGIVTLLAKKNLNATQQRVKIRFYLACSDLHRGEGGDMHPGWRCR